MIFSPLQQFIAGRHSSGSPFVRKVFDSDVAALIDYWFLERDMPDDIKEKLGKKTEDGLDTGDAGNGTAEGAAPAPAARRRLLQVDWGSFELPGGERTESPARVRHAMQRSLAAHVRHVVERDAGGRGAGCAWAEGASGPWKE
jgi:hypothetical protein